ncbi:ketopantoate reductase family protein [Planomicrobium sp. YIM 101495]|uniref:ketopantoate reductase family protein n=1 Tax=Planomicrobium sp. YIM 101495 TaxID=2665160 RepID=UPI0018A8C5A8|nr:2-dehydropantoate 2-reductase [Planomicrobium sp. YIM 101495]
MKVTIIGAGAVGMLLATLFAEKGATVQVVAKRQEQADLITYQGLIRDGSEFRVEALTDYAKIDRKAFVFVTVKQPHLAEVIPEIISHCPEQPLVFLQNGMLHLEQLSRLHNARIAAGSVEHGVKKIADNEITHAGAGRIQIAAVHGTGEDFAPLLSDESIGVHWHDDVDRLLFRKTLVNCMINPLTALMGIKNGELLTNVHAYTLMKALYMELYGAFPEIEEMLPFEEVTALCAATAENHSSMRADRQAGRKMELDTILHYTISRAPENLPLLRTLYHLLKSTEE